MRTYIVTIDELGGEPVSAHEVREMLRPELAPFEVVVQMADGRNARAVRAVAEVLLGPAPRPLDEACQLDGGVCDCDLGRTRSCAKRVKEREAREALARG